jgi:hypothetical protein
MGKIWRRARAGLVVIAMIAFGLVTAGSAGAATCENLPGSTPGTDVSAGGVHQRVPAISNIQVCVGGASTGVLSVDRAGHGYCSTACLSVLLFGGDVDSEGVSVSWRQDGVTKSEGIDPDGAGGDSICVISVGSPDAPFPNCEVAIGPELGDPVGDVRDQIDELTEPLDPVIETYEQFCENQPGVCEGDPQAIKALVNHVECVLVPTAPGCPVDRRS